jgi:hypothetical protein
MTHDYNNLEGQIMNKKLILVVLVVIVLIGTKWVLWEMEVSSGKRVGNLTKISKKGKFPFLKTWEGTLDEGSGDKLTSYFSVKDEAIAQELYTYEGKEVILFYTQHILGFPRETNYVIVAWKPKEEVKDTEVATTSSPIINALSKTIFCSFLGTLYLNKDLYESVKDHISKNNLYLLKQYKVCNN